MLAFLCLAFGYFLGKHDYRYDDPTVQDTTIQSSNKQLIDTESTESELSDSEANSVADDPATKGVEETNAYPTSEEEKPFEPQRTTDELPIKDEPSNSEQTNIGIPSRNDGFIIPAYSGVEVIQINDNQPSFSLIDSDVNEYVQFSSLDYLGRCGIAEWIIGPKSLPTEERGSIGMIKPSGWHTVKYDFVDGKYLYNRCHLIAYELCGVNDDERNLITGTRFLNLDGMLSYEDQVCWYIRNSGNHVLYRVTPWFEGENLVASGVQIEALSVEDNGAGICLNIFCFNIQPGVIIDYLTGESYAEAPNDIPQNDAETRSIEPEVFIPSEGVSYILNTNTMRFHLADCQSVQDMKSSNREEFFGTREELIEEGYIPCGRCHP